MIRLLVCNDGDGADVMAADRTLAINEKPYLIHIRFYLAFIYTNDNNFSLLGRFP